MLIVVMAFSCKRVSNSSLEEKTLSRLQQVMDRGTLRVVTDFNSTSYFIYRGQPMGYQYEMLQELANHLGVRLEVRVDNDLERKFDMLENGEIDLIAVNLSITKDRRQKMDFTVAHTQACQVLVQRKPDNWRKLSSKALADSLLKNQLDLAGKTIYVQKNSSYVKRLKNLSEEIGENITIVEVEEAEDKLIEKVANGEINYTVSDENVARVNQTFFGNIDISLPVSFQQNLAWAVPKGSKDLKYTIDSWLTDFKDSRKYAMIYHKYYQSTRTAEIKESDYFTNISGKISPYDAAIKQFSEEIGWDWRLVASMIYQESRFNPQAKSWAGAYGLMQLMPRTGERFGVTAASSPKMQIRAGIMYIRWLDERFQFIKDINERQKFILASYNVGMGHVLDARALAIKYDGNPDIWEGNVAEFLLSKADPRIYSDPVVKYGYCRGVEPYQYVTDIIERYDHYKNLVSE
jgi:membrane-bound lytic murein transglycosylase F